jgi:hypothetical protein
MPLPANALRADEFMFKSVSNEGNFTFETETFFRPCLRSQCSVVTEICHMALPAHALQSLQVRMKWVSYEGHFTLVAETVSRPYLPSHCSGLLKAAIGWQAG